MGGLAMVESAQKYGYTSRLQQVQQAVEEYIQGAGSMRDMSIKQSSNSSAENIELPRWMSRSRLRC